MGFWARRRPGRAYLAGAPMLVAHRGGAGLAPENTLVAFRSAIDHWRADMLEMDVRLTKDGRVAVIHDATVDRTTDGSGAVADLTLDELQSLDAGFRFHDAHGACPFRGRGLSVPTLDQVLDACPEAWINVEVKEAPAAAPTIDVVRRQGAQHRVLIAAEQEEWRADARGYGGPWGASKRQVMTFVVSHRLPGGGPFTPDADVFQVPETWKGHRIVTPRFVREAHRRNIPVQVWTVDGADTMRRLLAMGVDGIQTDRPDRLAAVLTEMFGRRAPPGSEAAT